MVMARNLSQKGGQSDHPLRIRVRGVHPTYLHFPDVEDNVLPLGLIYLDSKFLSPSLPRELDEMGKSERRRFLKQTPFRISNVQSGEKVISVTSNLLKQCFIFRDEQCTLPETPCVQQSEEASEWHTGLLSLAALAVML